MYAYLDPASGSIIASAIAAGAAGVGVAARMSFRKARRKLHLGGEDESPGTTEGDTPATS